jgi:hypothetical protein
MGSVEGSAISIKEPPITVTTEAGRLRVVLPSATIEADDVDGLLHQVAEMLETIKSSLRSAAEDAVLREIEKNAPRRAALELLAARYPPPPEWFDELE